jgi:RNA polymerase sigma factor (sigma-70 family)
MVRAVRGVSTGELVGLAAGGDQSAWNELVRRYGRLVHAIPRSFRLSAADGDEVFQAVMLRFAQHLGRLREPERAGAWLATTARNECLRLIRNAQRLVLTDQLDDVADTPDSVETTVEKAEQLVALRVAFARLAESDRALLGLVAERCPYEKIGSDLGMAVGSIGPTRARALQRLRIEFYAVYEGG